MTKIGKLVPAKPKFIFNSKTKTRQMIGNSSGFPDYIVFRWIHASIKDPTNPSGIELFDYDDCGYVIHGVECKTNGKLDKIEKAKCEWLLKNKIFSKILIAHKGKKRGEILYKEYK